MSSSSSSSSSDLTTINDSMSVQYKDLQTKQECPSTYKKRFDAEFHNWRLKENKKYNIHVFQQYRFLTAEISSRRFNKIYLMIDVGSHTGWPFNAPVITISDDYSINSDMAEFISSQNILNLYTKPKGEGIEWNSTTFITKMLQEIESYLDEVYHNRCKCSQMRRELTALKPRDPLDIDLVNFAKKQTDLIKHSYIKKEPL